MNYIKENLGTIQDEINNIKLKAKLLGINNINKEIYKYYSNKIENLYDIVYYDEDTEQIKFSSYRKALKNPEYSILVTSTCELFKEATESVLDLGRFNTSNVTDMCGMFIRSDVVELDLSTLNTSKVTDMSDMFLSCVSLKALNIKNFDTSNVVYMSGMFHNCNDIKQIDVSSFDTSKVVTMQNMFSNCYGIKSLDLGNFNTSNVVTMFGMFYSDTNLEGLNVSSFDVSHTQSLKTMFYRCKKLRRLNLFDKPNEQCNVNEMFYDCEEDIIPDWYLRLYVGNSNDVSMEYRVC